MSRLRAGAEALLNALAPILRELRPKQEPSAAAPQTALDHPRLQADLQQLLELLRKSDLASLELFALLRERHGDALQQSLDPLDEAMTNLDLELAAQLCVELQQKYTA